MNIEITFSKSGNTIVGNYSAYASLDKAIQAKSVFVPDGAVIKADTSEIVRLTEYVGLFGHCIKTKAGFIKACELAGIEFSL